MGAILAGAGALAFGASLLAAQTPDSAAPSTATVATAPAETAVSAADRRKAAKLYFKANQHFQESNFELAMQEFSAAARLNPAQKSYAMAAAVVRSHYVTELVQQAAQARMRGEAGRSRALLARAFELDPESPQAVQHLYELSDEQALGDENLLYQHGPEGTAEAVRLAPAPGVHDFHLQTSVAQAIQQVFKSYGVAVALDASVRQTPLRLDLEEANFEQATRALEIATDIFFVPLDPHRVIVARDTPENRQKFQRQEVETIYLSGLSEKELNDVAELAKNVFEIPVSHARLANNTVTLRGPGVNLDAFNAMMRSVLDGRNQVLLDAKIFQLGHSRQLTTGISLPQTMSVFNVYAEAQSVLTSNAALVEQIVSAGLAAKGDTLSILAILLGAGLVTNDNLANGFATFGGGALGTFGLAPGATSITFSLNSSDTRALDNVQLRLGDGEPGTVRNGMRYPITTSSFSSLLTSNSKLAGLTSAGTSSALSSLLSSLSAVTSTPMIEYQNLGLTLTATPKALREGDVALTVDLKLTALTGKSLNGIPVLASRAYSGVVTLREGESAMVVSEITKQESKAVTGAPGEAEIPGLNDITSKDSNQNEARLLIVLTPYVVRATQRAGHTPMMRIERNAAQQQQQAPPPQP